MTWRVVALIVAFCSALPAVALSQTPVQETEPNNTPATADTVVLGTVVTGHISSRGQDTIADIRDFWVVQANAGDTIWVDVDHCNPHCYETDVRIRLLGSDGTSLVALPYLFDGWERQLKFFVTKAGPYFVEVTMTSTVPGPVSNAYTLKFFEIHCPEDANEPNDTVSTATPQSFPFHTSGLMCPARDTDVFSFAATAGTALEWSLAGQVASTHDGSVNMQILSPTGEDIADYREDGRYTLTTGGTYYARLRWTGCLGCTYTLQMRDANYVPPGPGDPVVTRAAGLGGGAAFIVEADGSFWAGDEANSIENGEYVRMLRHVQPDGSRLRYPLIGQATPRVLAHDALGTMLVMTFEGIQRFAPSTSLQAPFIPIKGLTGLAVGRQGIWLTEFTVTSDLTGVPNGVAALHRFSRDGFRRASYNLAGLLTGRGNESIQHLVLGPNGEPHFSLGPAIYRMENGNPRLIRRYADGAQISGLAVDSAGQLYVAVDRRIALVDVTGAIVADTFSRWLSAPSTLAFGRNSDGSPNRRLFVRDGGKIVELDSAAVRFPGVDVGFPELVSYERAAQDFLGGTPLTKAERTYLDANGNQNGYFDLGDLHALIGRERVALKR